MTENEIKKYNEIETELKTAAKTGLMKRTVYRTATRRAEYSATLCDKDSTSDAGKVYVTVDDWGIMFNTDIGVFLSVSYHDMDDETKLKFWQDCDGCFHLTLKATYKGAFTRHIANFTIKKTQ